MCSSSLARALTHLVSWYYPRLEIPSYYLQNHLEIKWLTSSTYRIPEIQTNCGVVYLIYIWQHPALLSGPRGKVLRQHRNDTTLYVASVFLMMKENTFSLEPKTSVRFSPELHFQFWCTERGEDCGSSGDRASGSVCMPLLQREWRHRNTRRMPPGQLTAMLIWLLFKAIFLSDLVRSVFNVLLTCRVPGAAGAWPAPSRHWQKGGGEQGYENQPNQSCSKFADSFNNRS